MWATSANRECRRETSGRPRPSSQATATVAPWERIGMSVIAQHHGESDA
jgi:hypothetical protein